MKIFNWVHRRVHTNMDYCRVPHHKKGDPYVSDGGREEHVEKNEETEKEALLMDLHHVTSIQQVLEGILTIGTLGHLEYHCQKEFLDLAPHVHQEFQSVPPASKPEPAKTEKENEEEEEEEPVEVAPSAAHPNHNLTTESFKQEMLDVLDIKNGNAENNAEEEGDLLEPLLKEINANRRERITLADLFLASEDDSNKADPTSLQVAPASGTVALQKEAISDVETKAKPASPPCAARRGRSSLAKKLTSWKKGGEDSPPATKKLHRVKCTLSYSPSNAINPGGHGAYPSLSWGARRRWVAP